MAVEAPEAVGPAEAGWGVGGGEEVEAGAEEEAVMVAGSELEVEPGEGIRNRREVRCRNWDPKCRLGTCKYATSCCCS